MSDVASLKLKTAAPGLYGLLVRISESQDLEFLEAAYQCARQSAPPDFVPREDGVSFNPQLARVAQLALTECGIKDVEMLAAGFFLCCQTEISLQHFARPREIAARVRDMIQQPTAAGYAALSDSMVSLAKVYMLDLLRHVHQVDAETQFLILEAAAGFLGAGGANLRASESPRVNRMIKRCLMRSIGVLPVGHSRQRVVEFLEHSDA